MTRPLRASRARTRGRPARRPRAASRCRPGRARPPAPPRRPGGRRASAAGRPAAPAAAPRPCFAPAPRSRGAAPARPADPTGRPRRCRVRCHGRTRPDARRRRSQNGQLAWQRWRVSRSHGCVCRVAVMRVFTFAERPDLAERTDEVPAAFPEYMGHGEVLVAHWDKLRTQLPELQLVLWDEDRDSVVGYGRTIPAREREGLPGGVDDMVGRWFGGGARPEPDVLSALLVVVDRRRRGAA